MAGPVGALTVEQAGAAAARTTAQALTVATRPELAVVEAEGEAAPRPPIPASSAISPATGAPPARIRAVARGEADGEDMAGGAAAAATAGAVATIAVVAATTAVEVAGAGAEAGAEAPASSVERVAILLATAPTPKPDTSCDQY